MALLRPSELARLPRDAVVLDLGDLASQGRQLCAAAQAQADQIVADAKKKREFILAGAREGGFAKGMEEGLARGRDEGLRAGEKAALDEWRAKLSKLEQSWATALARLEAEREAMMQAARADVVTLALRIAERIVHRQIECDPSTVVDQVAAALAHVAQPSGLVIAVHPDDAALVQAAIPTLSTRLAALRHASLVSDASLARGSCILRSHGGGEVNASLHTQLERIARAIVPDRPPLEDKLEGKP